MNSSDEIDRGIVERALAVWFKAGSACTFAAQFASGNAPRTAYATFSRADASVKTAINSHFGAAGRDQRAAVAVFPSIANEAQLVEFLCSLCTDARWRCQRVESESPGSTAIVLEWKTEGDQWSPAMGLAPLLTMPTTRRAPFVAIAAWPGPSRKPTSKFVGFIDMPDGSSAEEHAIKLSKTEFKTTQHLAGDPDSKILKKIAFRLSTHAVAGIDFG